MNEPHIGDYCTNKKINLPKKSKDDYAHSLIKATAGTVPIAGSFLAEFIATVITPPYERKKEEWMRSITDSIEEIQSKIDTFNIDDLVNNDTFQDAIFTTTKSAMATSSKIKLESLLNALLNVALNNSPNKITSAIFLNFVDRFTEAHIQICSILESPNEHRDNRGDFDTKETYRELIDKKLPSLGKELVNVIVKELHDNDLVTLNADSIDNHPPLFQEGTTCITPFGKKFIEFIKKPSV